MKLLENIFFLCRGGCKVGARRGGEGTCPPYFLQSLVFCNHFRELETVLFEVELIINNALLPYVYPNTTETFLTPNNFFGRQPLYFSNTTSTVATNLAVLSSTTDKINHISNHFGIGGDMNM